MTHFDSSMRFITLISLAALAACSSPWDPEGPPGMEGQIVGRDQAISTGGAPTIHVKEDPNEQCGVIFLVRNSTQIRRRLEDGSTMPASIAELTIGARVAVWSEFVMESCPGQSFAEAVEIQGSGRQLLDSP
jgi:hypothetical protein